MTDHPADMPADTSDTPLTISQMCEAFDVTPRALRFYEQKELLTPLRIGSRRLYSRKDRARLTLILRGKRFGFSLEDIRQLLEMYDPHGTNEVQLRRTLSVARERLAEMEGQRAELGIAIEDLRSRLAEGERLLTGLRRAAE